MNPPLSRNCRYQGAILRRQQILLLKNMTPEGRVFWSIPGGHAEPGETEDETLLREMQEETQLLVKIERLLLDEPGLPDLIYQRLKTYQCTPVGGEAGPGFEPPVADMEQCTITDTSWFDLWDETSWDALLLADPITYPLLQRIKKALVLEGQSPDGASINPVRVNHH